MKKIKVGESMLSDRGYRILEEYKNETTSLRMLCPKGHEILASWRKIREGGRCVECTKDSMQDKVRKIFLKEGYILQVEEYKNSQERMACICPAGHSIEVRLGSFNQGIRCAKCAFIKASENIQKSESVRVKAEFEAQGYILLGEYVHSQSPVAFVCPKGHTHEITPISFRAGSRCLFCSKKAPVTQEIVQEAFEKEGYKLLGEYINSKTLLDFICPKGHQHKMSWNSFQGGSRCLYCCRTPPVSQETVKDLFQNRGFTLLDEYVDCNTPMRFVCTENHYHQLSWTNFLSGTECVYCNYRKIGEEQKSVNKIKLLISNLVRCALRNQKVKKTFSFTGFAKTIAESVHKALGDRPEGCHLDHIIPQSFFDHRRQDELLACWDIENLRWLPAKANISRGNRITENEIKELSIKQVEILKKASRIPKRIHQKLKTLLPS